MPTRNNVNEINDLGHPPPLPIDFTVRVRQDEALRAYKIPRIPPFSPQMTLNGGLSGEDQAQRGQKPCIRRLHTVESAPKGLLSTGILQDSSRMKINANKQL